VTLRHVFIVSRADALKASGDDRDGELSSVAKRLAGLWPKFLVIGARLDGARRRPGEPRDFGKYFYNNVLCA
jgi:hypothetical protein